MTRQINGATDIHGTVGRWRRLVRVTCAFVASLRAHKLVLYVGNGHTISTGSDYIELYEEQLEYM